jgi:tetratricopeptide (TPR) repeat protein
MARRAVAQSGQSAPDEEIEALARGWRGVVGQMVARTDDLAQARAAMDRALEWQYHLFEAGDYEAASNIVTAVILVLDRWGERDRAKALLRVSIETLEGFSKAVAQGNLANLLIDEGKLDEALATYQEVYRTFEALGARQQMAATLGQQGSVLAQKGEIGSSIARYTGALDIYRLEGGEAEQAICLHQLSILYHFKGDYATALARSQEAEKLNRSSGREHLLAGNLHQQGLILNRMAHAAQTDEERTAHLRAAFERFQQSLTINRRIGNEADCVIHRIHRDISAIGQSGQGGHRPRIPGQRPRKPGPIRRRAGEVPAGVEHSGTCWSHSRGRKQPATHRPGAGQAAGRVNGGGYGKRRQGQLADGSGRMVSAHRRERRFVNKTGIY